MFIIWIVVDFGLCLCIVVDIFDFIGVVYGVDSVILYVDDFVFEFLDFCSGLLGELFQKVINYCLLLVFVFVDIDVYGFCFSELVFEYCQYLLICFFDLEEVVWVWLEWVQLFDFRFVVDKLN